METEQYTAPKINFGDEKSKTYNDLLKAGIHPKNLGELADMLGFDRNEFLNKKYLNGLRFPMGGKTEEIKYSLPNNDALLTSLKEIVEGEKYFTPNNDSVLASIKAQVEAEKIRNLSSIIDTLPMKEYKGNEIKITGKYERILSPIRKNNLDRIEKINQFHKIAAEKYARGQSQRQRDIFEARI